MYPGGVQTGGHQLPRAALAAKPPGVMLVPSSSRLISPSRAGSRVADTGTPFRGSPRPQLGSPPRVCPPRGGAGVLLGTPTGNISHGGAGSCLQGGRRDGRGARRSAEPNRPGRGCESHRGAAGLRRSPRRWLRPLAGLCSRLRQLTKAEGIRLPLPSPPISAALRSDRREVRARRVGFWGARGARTLLLGSGDPARLEPGPWGGCPPFFSGYSPRGEMLEHLWARLDVWAGHASRQLLARQGLSSDLIFWGGEAGTAGLRAGRAHTRDAGWVPGRHWKLSPFSFSFKESLKSKPAGAGVRVWGPWPALL